MVSCIRILQVVRVRVGMPGLVLCLHGDGGGSFLPEFLCSQRLSGGQQDCCPACILSCNSAHDLSCDIFSVQGGQRVFVCASPCRPIREESPLEICSKFRDIRLSVAQDRRHDTRKGLPQNHGYFIGHFGVGERGVRRLPDRSMVQRRIRHGILRAAVV